MLISYRRYKGIPGKTHTQQVPFYNLDMVISVGYRIVALPLMIAESRTEEKDVMVKVVVNLINKDNQ